MIRSSVDFPSGPEFSTWPIRLNSLSNHSYVTVSPVSVFHVPTMEPSRETSGPGFGGGAVCCCPKARQVMTSISTTMANSLFIGGSLLRSEEHTSELQSLRH